MKTKGKVQDALAHIEKFFTDNPDDVLSFRELQTELGIKDVSNFRNRIRQHKAFKAGLDRLGVQEVNMGSTKGFARLTHGFTMIEDPADPLDF